jgi:uncharacterized LabA/DUF88 family protein
MVWRATLELSIEMRPDVVILVTGDADFAYLATKLRRHGIGEVSAVEVPNREPCHANGCVSVVQ